MNKKIFNTNYKYKDRQTKAKYVWLKYKKILKGKILDVGADQCYIKTYLPKDSKYTSLGLGSNKIDIKLDLEKNNLPFKNNHFDVVLCLDVLEHLDNIHDTFNELCRVSKKYVIISLPDPYGLFIKHLITGRNYNKEQHLKFYGLPKEKPKDRHKWFFSIEEAKNFIFYNVKKNNMEVVQIDYKKSKSIKYSFLKKILLEIFFKKCKLILKSINKPRGTIWVVLKKL